MTEDVQEIDADDIVQEDVVGVEPVVEEEPAAPEWTAEDEEEARLFGWKSPDEWQGDKPAGYIGKPDEFLDRVQRSRIFKTMQDKLQTTETRAEEIARKQEAMNHKALERQRDQHTAEMARITTAQRVAASEADVDAYDALETQRQGLIKQAPQETPEQPQNAPDPVLDAYRSSDDGKWLDNPILAKTAVDLINGNKEVLLRGTQEQIAYAEAEVRKLYPAYFPQAAAMPAPRTAVDGGGLAGGAGARPNGAFGKLPGEAKTSFTRFVKEGLYTDSKEDREDFANEYNRA